MSEPDEPNRKRYGECDRGVSDQWEKEQTLQATEHKDLTEADGSDEADQRA